MDEASERSLKISLWWQEHWKSLAATFAFAVFAALGMLAFKLSQPLSSPKAPAPEEVRQAFPDLILPESTDLSVVLDLRRFQATFFQYRPPTSNRPLADLAPWSGQHGWRKVSIAKNQLDLEKPIDENHRQIARIRWLESSEFLSVAVTDAPADATAEDRWHMIHNYLNRPRRQTEY